MLQFPNLIIRKEYHTVPVFIVNEFKNVCEFMWNSVFSIALFGSNIVEWSQSEHVTCDLAATVCMLIGCWNPRVATTSGFLQTTLRNNCACF